jgi:iron complex outermembrane receptor protein
VTDEDGGWSLTANVKNAFNKVYYTGGFALGEIYQINTLVPGDRRTFTVELRYKF